MSSNSSIMANLSFSFTCARSNLSTNNISFPARWEIAQELEEAVPYVATIEAIFFFTASMWNLSILVGYSMKPKLLKEPANVFFLNLAITDFLLSWITLLHFMSLIKGGFFLGCSDVVRCQLCQFIGFLFAVLMTVSLHVLAVLSLDRFILLYKPVRYHDFFSWKKAAVVVVIIWIFSISLSSLPFAGFGSYRYSKVLAGCQISWFSESYRGIQNIYFAYLTAAESLLPLVCLLLFNIFTYRIICRSLYTRYQRRLSYTTTAVQLRQNHNENQKRVIYLFTALLVVNTINWVPVLVILCITAVFGIQVIPFAVFLFGWLSYTLNPVAHPIIELCFIRGLRDILTCQAKKDIICYRCCCRQAMLRRDSNIPSILHSRTIQLDTNSTMLREIASTSTLTSTLHLHNGDITSSSSDEFSFQQNSIVSRKNSIVSRTSFATDNKVESKREQEDIYTQK